jgi:hypothetical protein
MQPTPTIPSHPSHIAASTLTIRMAAPGDVAALDRLAQLDSAPLRLSVPTLLAEVGGELRAALPLDGGPAIADPFRPTAELVAILAARARQLAPSPRKAGRRRRLLRGPRPATATRA